MPRLETSLLIRRPLDETFAFFADAANLQRITPPWLDFRITTPMPLEMREGAFIDYRLRLRGMPMHWRSQITVWSPPYRFVDEQVTGPYRLWRHLHTFREVEGGTEVGDSVDYLVPGGRLIDALFVRRELDTIFRHRQQATLDVFGVASDAPIAVHFR
jgi:ligand-binding SRPBCC domain-containing protein